jgi:predicted MFS family arabinose efflux permease
VLRRLLPPETDADAGVLLTTRGVRAFVDGLVSVVLPTFLIFLGFDGVDIGAIVTGTLLGSAATTLLVGIRGHHLPRRVLLQVAAASMFVTGVAFGLATSFWVLLVFAILGTLNPSSGDVSVFLPTEQALLPSTVSNHQRTALFARYSLIGFSIAAVGSLAAGLPDVAIDHGASESVALRSVFFVYAGAAVVVFLLYRHLSPGIERHHSRESAPLGPSRPTVYRLAATFSLDAFGGGFVVQSILALWLLERFGLSLAATGFIFFWTGLLGGFSGLVAVRIARRIGLVRTMVYTHLPANVLLIITPFMPTLGLAVTCLLLRAALSQMDVPARTSYVMAVVTPAERPAAASVTNVPRSLAAAIAPLPAGWMLTQSDFGWPLLIGGVIKAAYDLILLVQFRELRPPEEQPGVAAN